MRCVDEDGNSFMPEAGADWDAAEMKVLHARSRQYNVVDAVAEPKGLAKLLLWHAV